MTSFRFQSGAHMNERTCIAWMLLAASSRESYSASLASIATRSRITRFTIVRLNVACCGAEPSRFRMTRARQCLIGRVAQQEKRALGGNDVEDEVDDAGQDLRERLDGNEGLPDFAQETEQPRLTAIASLASIGSHVCPVGYAAIGCGTALARRGEGGPVLPGGILGSAAAGAVKLASVELPYKGA